MVSAVFSFLVRLVPLTVSDTDLHGWHLKGRGLFANFFRVCCCSGQKDVMFRRRNFVSLGVQTSTPDICSTKSKALRSEDPR